MRKIVPFGVVCVVLTTLARSDDRPFQPISLGFVHRMEAPLGAGAQVGRIVLFSTWAALAPVKIHW